MFVYMFYVLILYTSQLNLQCHPFNQAEVGLYKLNKCGVQNSKVKTIHGMHTPELVYRWDDNGLSNTTV